MTYTAFDGTKPTTAQTRQAAITSILNNELALRDACVMAQFPGFDYSVSGGTATQPATMWFKKSAEWIKAALTWGTTGGSDGNVTVAVWSYSANSGGAYSTIGTCAYTFDSDGNLTAAAWS